MTSLAEGLTFGRLYFVPRLSDYAQLTKLRVTTLIVMTAWCGFFFGSRKGGSAVARLGPVPCPARHRHGFQRYSRTE